MMALLVCGVTTAATINVPADYTTIQAAVDAASNGDEILVAPGTYTSTGDQVVDMLGKAITLRASGTPEETIIDGEGARRVLRCGGGETPATIIEGFTITGGSTASGGGIYCSNASPTLTDCVIENNTASQVGGGIWCVNNNSTISGCTISNNIGANIAGGIYCYTSSPTLTDCTISDNASLDGGGGGFYCSESSPTISGCTISGNQAAQSGGGIDCVSKSSPTITDCMIINNTAITSGGGIRVYDSFPTLTNTHVCGNVSDQINGVWNDNGGNEINEVCPDFVGACCTGNQSWCVAASGTDCEYFGGVFMGYGVQCADVSCPTSCLGDINGDGQVSTNDLLTVIANWGPCP
jgi:parallel beta-helix repeat protein